jgi:hypothetical protein
VKVGAAVARATIRVINSIDGTGKGLISLHAPTLLDKARRQTGLDDFGGTGFLEPMRVLLDACEKEGRLTFLGRLVVRADIVQLLATRLRLEEASQRDPAVASTAVRQPLFITGLPRTGTTLLHALLGQDPAHRLPETWEVMYPWSPTAAADDHSDPRIALAESRIRWLSLLAPEFKTIHPIGARLPIECIALTSPSFLSPRFHTLYHVPSYQAWLTQQNLHPAYAFHKRFLQYLQRPGTAKRWVLKAPAHLFSIPELLDVYPDAMIVQTHRDPLTVLASVASLTAELQGAFAHSVDLAEIGAEVVERWAGGLDGVLKLRRSNPTLDGRILDVDYASLVEDPIATVRRLYHRFDMRFTDDLADRMHRFLVANPQGKYGAHRYSLAKFGLDPETLLPRFKEYRDYFDITPEHQYDS